MISYWFSLSTDRWHEKSEKRAIIYDIPCMNHHKISISERCAKSKFPMEDSNSSLWLHFIHLIIVFRCSNENHMKTFRCRVLYALLWKCDWNSLLDNRMHRISLSLSFNLLTFQSKPYFVGATQAGFCWFNDSFQLFENFVPTHRAHSFLWNDERLVSDFMADGQTDYDS